MEMKKLYKLLFDGSITRGSEINRVKANIASLFKIDGNKVETLFSGKTIVLRQGIDYETAEKYKMRLEKAGIICAIQHADDMSSSESSGPEDVMVCPKCGYKQQKSLECFRCGIVISKYLEREREEEANLASHEKFIDNDSILTIYNDSKETSLSFDEIKIKNITTIVFFLSLALIITSLFLKDRYPDRQDVLRKLYKVPQQNETNALPFRAEAGGIKYLITPLYSYELYGLIVSYYDSTGWWDITHKFLWKDRLNVKDLCVVYGANILTEVYKNMRFKSGSYTCICKFKNNKASLDFDGRYLSNNHLLANKRDIKKAIMKARRGDQIHLKGYLSSYSHSGGKFRRGTSITRKDTGNGACETIYVTEFTILKKANQLWRFLFSFSTILLGCCIVFLGIFYVKELYRLKNQKKTSTALGNIKALNRAGIQFKLKVLFQLLLLLLILYLWMQLH